MSEHKPPAYRVLTKLEGDDKFTEVIAIWNTAKSQTFGVQVTNADALQHLANNGGIMVVNKPKTAEPTKPAAKKSVSQQRKPAA